MLWNASTVFCRMPSASPKPAILVVQNQGGLDDMRSGGAWGRGSTWWLKTRISQPSEGGPASVWLRSELRRLVAATDFDLLTRIIRNGYALPVNLDVD